MFARMQRFFQTELLEIDLDKTKQPIENDERINEQITHDMFDSCQTEKKN